ncbi:hypothetical protein ACMD2_25806 [Ananas comosus]|nr:hypothetical protein ACMD2_25806 [Ananas comosus]
MVLRPNSRFPYQWMTSCRDHTQLTCSSPRAICRLIHSTRDKMLLLNSLLMKRKKSSARTKPLPPSKRLRLEAQKGFKGAGSGDCRQERHQAEIL